MRGRTPCEVCACRRARFAYSFPPHACTFYTPRTVPHTQPLASRTQATAHNSPRGRPCATQANFDGLHYGNVSCLLVVLPSGATGGAPIAGLVDGGILGNVSSVGIEVRSSWLCFFDGTAVGAEYDQVADSRRVHDT